MTLTNTPEFASVPAGIAEALENISTLYAPLSKTASKGKTAKTLEHRYPLLRLVSEYLGVGEPSIYRGKWLTMYIGSRVELASRADIIAHSGFAKDEEPDCRAARGVTGDRSIEQEDAGTGRVRTLPEPAVNGTTDERPVQSLDCCVANSEKQVRDDSTNRSIEHGASIATASAKSLLAQARVRKTAKVHNTKERGPQIVAAGPIARTRPSAGGPRGDDSPSRECRVGAKRSWDSGCRAETGAEQLSLEVHCRSPSTLQSDDVRSGRAIWVDGQASPFIELRLGEDSDPSDDEWPEFGTLDIHDSYGELSKGRDTPIPKRARLDEASRINRRGRAREGWDLDKVAHRVDIIERTTLARIRDQCHREAGQSANRNTSLDSILRKWLMDLSGSMFGTEGIERYDVLLRRARKGVAADKERIVTAFELQSCMALGDSRQDKTAFNMDGMRKHVRRYEEFFRKRVSDACMWYAELVTLSRSVTAYQKSISDKASEEYCKLIEYSKARGRYLSKGVDSRTLARRYIEDHILPTDEEDIPNAERSKDEHRIRNHLNIGKRLDFLISLFGSGILIFLPSNTESIIRRDRYDWFRLIFQALSDNVADIRIGCEIARKSLLDLSCSDSRRGDIVSSGIIGADDHISRRIRTCFNKGFPAAMDLVGHGPADFVPRSAELVI